MAQYQAKRGADPHRRQDEPAGTRQEHAFRPIALPAVAAATGVVRETERKPTRDLPANQPQRVTAFED
jgi:hypothetical protein